MWTKTGEGQEGLAQANASTTASRAYQGRGLARYPRHCGPVFSPRRLKRRERISRTEAGELIERRVRTEPQRPRRPEPPRSSPGGRSPLAPETVFSLAISFDQEGPQINQPRRFDPIYRMILTSPDFTSGAVLREALPPPALTSSAYLSLSSRPL